MRLDPIVISPYDAAWPYAFEKERDRISPVLEPWLARPIEHVGSTSIPGMAAKAIIDMVAVVHTNDGLEAAVDPLRTLGWVHAPEPEQAQPFGSFCTPSIAQRTHHLHVFAQSSASWQDLLAFRDYLRTHPGLAAAYAALKRELASQHGSDPNRREPYRRGKDAFIEEVTALARATHLRPALERAPASLSGQDLLRGVVFDLDDTLTAAEFKDEMWVRMIERIRAVLPEADGGELRRRASAARELYYAEVMAGSMNLDAFWRKQLAEAVAPWGQLPEATIRMCIREREMNIERRRLMTGARELIEALRAARLRIGLLTNGPSDLQRRKIAVTGLDRLLDAVAISQEIGVSKPQADAYRCAARLLGCRPEQTAMVGDQLEWDVEGPLRAGYRTAVLVGGRTVRLPPGGVQVGALSEVFGCLIDA